MGRRQNRKRNELPPRFKKLRQAKKSRRPSKPSFLKNLASTIYQMAIALPFVPAPVKAVADVIARETGLITVEANGNNNDTATVNRIFFCGELSARAFIQNCEQSTYSKGDFITKYTSVRPLTVTVNVTPSNPTASRCGYMNVGLIPYTGPLDFQKYRKLNYHELSSRDTMSGYPISKRVPSSRSISLTYNVPRSNTYLHMGVQFGSDVSRSATDGIMMVCVAFECYDRDSYDDFKASDFSVDVRFNLKGMLLEPDLTKANRISSGYGVIDLIPSTTPLRSFRAKDGKWYDGTKMSYNADRNLFEGKAQLLTTVMDESERGDEEMRDLEETFENVST